MKTKPSWPCRATRVLHDCTTAAAPAGKSLSHDPIINGHYPSSHTANQVKNTAAIRRGEILSAIKVNIPFYSRFSFFALRRPFQSAHGAILPLFALILIPLLGVVAFLVDGGNAMRHQTALKTALDAASLRGAQALHDGSSTSEAKNIARNMVRANLLARRYSASQTEEIVAGLNIAFSSNDTAVSVGSIHAVPVYFAHVIPGFGSSITINAQSKAGFRATPGTPSPIPTSYVLVMDKSGSMHQLMADGQVKMDVLKRTVAQLLTNSTIDEFRFIAFAQRCRQASDQFFDMRIATEKQQALQWIANLQFVPDAATKMGCGMKRAHSFQNDAQHQNRAVILVSDGVPTFGVTPSDGCCGDAWGAVVCWADKLKSDYNSPVFTIGIGDGQVDTFDPDFLRRVAGIGPGDSAWCSAVDHGPQTDPPGDYLEVPDETSLAAAFSNITLQVSGGSAQRSRLLPASTER